VLKLSTPQIGPLSRRRGHQAADSQPLLLAERR